MLRAEVRAALAEGFEEKEVRRHFGLPIDEPVTQVQRRRMARHKARDVLRALVDVVTLALVSNGGAGVKIDGFARFFVHDNDANTKPKGVLYPVIDGYVIPRGRLVKESQTAAIGAGAYRGYVLPGVLPLGSFRQVYGAEFDFYESPDIGANGEPSPVGVFAYVAPQSIEVQTTRAGAVSSGVHAWDVWLAVEGFLTQAEGGAVSLNVTNSDPVVPWSRYPGELSTVGRWAEFEARKLIPHDAWRFDDSNARRTYSAAAWLDGFPRERWAVLWDGVWRYPEWIDARAWWAQFGPWAAQFEVEGFAVPPAPKARNGRRRVSVAFERDAFIFDDYQ